MGELIMVGVIVVSAAVYLGSRYWKQFRAKNGEVSCGCNGGGCCPGGGCQCNESQSAYLTQSTSYESLEPKKEV